jgi:hypothetical protein
LPKRSNFIKRKAARFSTDFQVQNGFYNLSLTGINKSLNSLIHVQNFIRYPLINSTYLFGIGTAAALLEACYVYKV